jgi:uncharacterized protein YueI
MRIISALFHAHDKKLTPAESSSHCIISQTKNEELYLKNHLELKSQRLYVNIEFGYIKVI